MPSCARTYKKHPRNKLAHEAAIHNSDFLGKISGAVSRLARWFCRAKKNLKDIQHKLKPITPIDDCMRVPEAFTPSFKHPATCASDDGPSIHEITVQLVMVSDDKSIYPALVQSPFTFRTTRKSKIGIFPSALPVKSDMCPKVRVLRLKQDVRPDMSWRFIVGPFNYGSVVDTTRIIVEFSYVAVRPRTSGVGVVYSTSPKVGEMLGRAPHTDLWI